ncbi:MAG TPA: histidine phosphatase family protein [Rhabdochlamydiaceae bacterium]|nr:histidine phosphatase family protein [Rhabdochlamydiaceae bacterium]
MKTTLIILMTLYLGTAYGLPGQVIIVRHGEKNTITGELTSAGVERVEALSSYLTEPNNEPGFVGSAGLTNVVLFNYGVPFALFASRPVQRSDDFTVRCIQTLVPTALKLQLPIHSPYGPGQEQQLARSILNEPRFNGKNIVICWHHTFIAALIQAFGYVPPAGIVPTYPNRFDLVWVMTFPAPNPPAIVNPILQELLFDDPTTFP